MVASDIIPSPLLKPPLEEEGVAISLAFKVGLKEAIYFWQEKVCRPELLNDLRLFGDVFDRLLAV